MRKILYTVLLIFILKSQAKLPRSDCSLESFIYQLLIESYYVSGTILGAGATTMHQTVKSTCPVGTHILKVVKATRK